MPMVVALNMMDELRENGGSVHVNEMEEFLGVPVVPISAAKGEGIEELVKHAVHVCGKVSGKSSKTGFLCGYGKRDPQRTSCSHAFDR